MAAISTGVQTCWGQICLAGYHQLSIGGAMTDILIRDVPDDAVARIDASAERAGLSRAEYLRRLLVSQRGPVDAVTSGDWRRLSEIFADATDPR
jgi:hypothetical protein